MSSESTKRPTQPRTVLTWRSRPRLRPDPHWRTAPSTVLPGHRGSSSPPRRGERWTMPDCFSMPDAGAKCSSARAVIGASTTAGHAAAASLGVNRCARRDAGISTLDAASTAMPNASAATADDAGQAAPRVRRFHRVSIPPSSYRKYHHGAWRRHGARLRRALIPCFKPVRLRGASRFPQVTVEHRGQAETARSRVHRPCAVELWVTRLGQPAAPRATPGPAVRSPHGVRRVRGTWSGGRCARSRDP